MRVVRHLACVASFIALTACQPAPTATPAPPDAPVTADPAPIEAAVLPCGIIAQRGWTAEGSGSPGTLTVSGEIDLGSPGYGVSLARDDNEAAGATTTTLSLRLSPPAGITTQVVTATPVRYFGPAASAYDTVRIVCEGAELTTIPVTR